VKKSGSSSLYPGWGAETDGMKEFGLVCWQQWSFCFDHLFIMPREEAIRKLWQRWVPNNCCRSRFMAPPS